MSTAPETRSVDRLSERPESPSPAAPADVVPAPSCQRADADEPLGGDPPCWAHLFEDDEPATEQ